jgi:hypothetical protein
MRWELLVYRAREFMGRDLTSKTAPNAAVSGSMGPLSSTSPRPGIDTLSFKGSQMGLKNVLNRAMRSSVHHSPNPSQAFKQLLG